LRAKRFLGLGGVTHGHRGFDDHHRIRVDGDDVFDDRFDGPGVEIVGLGIVVGGGGDDDVVSASVGIEFVERCTEVQWLVGQKVLDLFVFDRGFFLIQQRDFLGNDIQRNDFVVLGQEDGVGQKWFRLFGQSFLGIDKVTALQFQAAIAAPVLMK